MLQYNRKDNKMDNHGKLKEIMFEDIYELDGIDSSKLSRWIWLWVDMSDGLRPALESIPGVSNMSFQSSTCYKVCLDPRYDRDFVKAEIESVVMCQGNKQSYLDDCLSVSTLVALENW